MAELAHIGMSGHQQRADQRAPIAQFCAHAYLHSPHYVGDTERACGALMLFLRSRMVAGERSAMGYLGAIEFQRSPASTRT